MKLITFPVKSCDFKMKGKYTHEKIAFILDTNTCIYSNLEGKKNQMKNLENENFKSSLIKKGN